jgi:PAS domain S-box-containing protein
MADPISQGDLTLQAAPAIPNHEEHFRIMMEGIQDSAIFFLDIPGFVQSWNKAAERLHGYANEEIVGSMFRSSTIRQRKLWRKLQRG